MQLMRIGTSSPMRRKQPILTDAINGNFRLFFGQFDNVLLQIGLLLPYDRVRSHL